MNKKIAGAITFLLLTSLTNAADFFDSVDSIGGASPPPIYRAFYDVTVNFDELQNGPESLTFNLPNGINTTVEATSFLPRQGYQFFDEDVDPPGTPDFWIPEGTPANEVGYKWFGSNDEFDVLISVYNGILNAIITNNDFRYGISRTSISEYRMYEFNYQFFPPTDILEISQRVQTSKVINIQEQDETYMSHLKSFDFSSRLESETRNSSTVLDVLIVWTEEARQEACPDNSATCETDINDTDGIDALIVSSVDHANVAYNNSDLNTRITRFHTAKYNGFIYSGEFFTDLQNLRENTPIRNLRNQVGADTVMAIIGSDFSEFEACGAAYVQSYPGCTDLELATQCGVGNSFKEFSYAITTRFCSIWDDTFTHELGHNMGANHVDVSGANAELTASWIQAVRANGFPDAFGHRTTGFKSIMSVLNTNASPTTARRLYFSNPNIQADGINTGVINTRNNARIIDQLTPVMSNYATRPDLIFANGFE